MYLSVYPFEVVSSVRARRSVAVSRYTSRHFPRVVDVIPNGVDTSLFRPGGPKSARPSVLAVGHRLRDRKRLDLLLEVFLTAVRPRLPEAELWLVCDEKVEAAGVRSFSTLLGEDLARLYREAWVFCLPSSYEGFGRPYIEALASGTAVVATPNPGALEVLGEGSHGILVEPSELGAALAGLLEDGQRRADLQERGLARAQAYAWDRVADRYEEIYESIRAARVGTVPR
jgi:glycosyltransferase involved in cell wall biosynthesis